jgi:pilus assembly protein CpaF
MIVANPSPVRPSSGQPVAALQLIEELMREPTLTEIMVNAPDAVYVERDGRVLLTDRRFDDENHLLAAIDALLSSVGRPLELSQPVVEVRLVDGSRLTVVLPPVAVDGPMFAIRKFSKTPYIVDDLVRFGTLSVQAAAFLQACVLARANLLISGGSSSGKTTLLNAITSSIDGGERIVTIEDAAELRLLQDHVCRLESLTAGEKRVTMRDLVRHAVRMRPDRLIVGEVRGAEALDMLQAMNTGHDGSMTTIHANSPRDALTRLETLVLMAGLDLPVRAVRQQIAGALNVVVQLGRLADGTRRVLSIAEVTGFDEQTIALQELFVSEAARSASSGRGWTRLTATGIRPKLMEKIHHLRLGSDELNRLFPQSAEQPMSSGRREVTSAIGHGVPSLDRRQPLAIS